MSYYIHVFRRYKVTLLLSVYLMASTIMVKEYNEMTTSSHAPVRKSLNYIRRNVPAAAAGGPNNSADKANSSSSSSKKRLQLASLRSLENIMSSVQCDVESSFNSKNVKSQVY